MRRSFLRAAASFALLPSTLRAQPGARIWRLGYLGAGVRPADGAPPAALRQGLRQLGYADGQNIAYDCRWAEARSERLPALAAELATQKPDVIVTFGGKSALALKDATSTIPVVFVGSGDPVAVGLVASLSRPGGNMTGISDQSTDLSAKRLELLKEAIPAAERVAVLWNADDRAMTLRYREIERAARVLHVTVQPYGVREPEDFDSAFAGMARARPDALVLVTDVLTNLNRKRVLEFATARAIPAIYEYAYLVRDGGLMSYGPDPDELFRRAAVYVDRILKGAKPGDLAVEQPTRYFMLVNVRTAKALGLAVPPSVLLRADEVIE